MQTLKTLKNKINSINVRSVVAEALDEYADDFGDLQREQLMQGLDSEGNTLKPYFFKEYADEKHAMNPLAGYGNPDLFYTGETHKSIFYEFSETEIGIEVNDIHGLEQKYSAGAGNPFRLNKESKFKIMPKVQIKIVQLCKEILK